MAYKRRTTRRRRKNSRPLSKHMVRAIKAISQGPIETKVHNYTRDWNPFLTDAAYLSGAAVGIRGPIHHHIPRIKNTATQTEGGFIGNKINLRGFRWEFHGYINLTSANPDTTFRFTIYSEVTDYPTVVSNPIIYTTTDPIIDNDFSTVFTWSRWNTQVANIHLQRTFKIDQASTGAASINKKFWWRAHRALTTVDEESALANDFFRGSKSKNYYWTLEVLAPGVTDLKTHIVGAINTSVYFKDP